MKINTKEVIIFLVQLAILSILLSNQFFPLVALYIIVVILNYIRRWIICFVVRFLLLATSKYYDYTLQDYTALESYLNILAVIGVCINSKYFSDNVMPNYFFLDLGIINFNVLYVLAYIFTIYLATLNVLYRVRATRELNLDEKPIQKSLKQNLNESIKE